MDPLHAVTLVAFGFLPSLFWLAFYLRKDWHPEPKYLITRTFFMGLVLAPLAVAGQWLLAKLVYSWNPLIDINTYPLFFLGAAFVEEVVKFLAVKFIVLHNADFDEPLDAMIYMITAALGFAAIENFLVLFQAFPNGASGAVQIWLYRFAGATFLHALTSAIVGYFLALSWFYHKNSQ
jgi:RsiW-degrading membrane proteinase PrsW (M82 family)